MAVFTAIAAAVVGALGITGTAATIFTAIGATVLSVGVSSLVLKNKLKGASGGVGGGRVQLPPATDNKIPVVYGQAFVGGPVVDAKISSDLKTMWYVVALAEHTDTTAGSGYTFDLNNVYYDGKRVQFGANGVVTGLINNTPSQTEIDTKVNGKIVIYLFSNGSNSPVNQSQPAYNIVPGWTVNDAMTNCAFAIVRVTYDQKAGTTSLGGLMCKITNSLDKPGSVIKDYLINTRYGCAVPLSRIDTASLTALDTYSDETINYGTGTQARYRINGPVQTGENCLNNLNYLADSCDSWLQYSELSAKWSVVINKPYVGSITNLFLVDSSNLIGGISISPINLNETYNQLEVAYPNQYIKDQTDYQVVELDDYAANIMSPNEAINKLNVDYPYVNNSVQALYLGVRKLLQSREDLTIGFKLDYSGIQIDAGDVIRVKHDDYGWDTLNSGNGKLFRVASVAEEKYSDGSLGVTISAFEYNGTIYDDRALLNFQPDPNTGLTDPNIISDPGTPNVAINPDASGVISSFNVQTWVPDTGSVLYMDFNYGNTSNTEQHLLYRTITSAAGTKFTNSDSNANVYTYLSVDINDLPAGNYYWSTVARNDFGGANSNSSALFFWPGAGINEANIIDANGVFSSGNILTSNNAIANLTFGANVYLLSGTGTLANNTYISVVNSTTPTANFEVTPTPSVPLNNATIQVIVGGINGNAIVPNTLPGNRVTPNTLPGNTLIGNTVNGNVIIGNTLNGNAIITATANGNIIINGTITNVQIATDTITSNNIRANAIIANLIAANAIVAGKIDANAVTANTIAANAIIAGKIDVNAVTANTIAANAITAGKIDANAVTANTIAANAVTAGKIAANAVTAGTIDANAVTANTIAANAITAGTIAANAVTANTIAANAVTAGTIAANAVTSGTVAANAITAGTVAANAITSNTIAANAVTAGKIDANAVTANTIAANAITAGTIAANAITAGTIAANAVDANALQAFSITGGKMAIGTIEAQNIKANTITFENLAIGSVTQSKSTLSDPIVKPIPFTNISNAWPANTRCVVPPGGVTIIPSTDPQSSANTEYTEGSRIQVSYSVKMYVDPGNVANVNQNWDQYNLVEIWKSGASSVFDRGLNTVRQAYDITGNSTSAQNQQLHALGYAPGGVDLYSSDGGNTWQTYNGNSTGKTISGAMSFTTTTFTSYPRFVESGCVGPFQTPDSGSLNSGVGSRVGANAAPIIWDQDAGTNSVRYITVSGGTVTTGYQNDFLSMEFTPYTAGNGFPYTTANAGYIFTGTNGDIFYSPTPFAPNENTTNAMRRENVPNLIKDLYSSYSNPANANTYTSVIVGQTGTVLRSERTVGASDFANSWSAKSIYVQGNTQVPVLTDLYAVAGDDTINNPATSKWVAVGQYGMIQYSSDDGDAWDQVYLGNSVSCDFNAVRYGNGVWVTCGDGGNIYISTDASNANAWTQIDTTNLNYTNGSSYGSIYGNSNNSRQLNTVNYNGEWDTWSIGGQGIILYSDDNANTWQVAYEQSPSETYDLTRVTFFGSWPNVANVSRPPAEQRILNNQIFSGTILDTSYVAGQETTYYLVIGNMNGNTILAGQIFLQVQEIKR